MEDHPRRLAQSQTLNDYYEAVSDMLAWTSTPNAPWTVVEGNDKLYARVKTLQTVCDAISRKIEET